MENTKAKNVIIIILIILVIGIIAYTIWMNYENKKQVDSLKEQIEKNNTVINENKEETKTSENDIYEKYKSLNIEWAGTSDGEYDDIKIQDGKVYIQHDILAKGYEGTPKKVLIYWASGMPEFIILTQEGDVYGTNGEFGGSVEGSVNVTKRLSNIKDMTNSNIGIVDVSVYYLTIDGELISDSGKTFEEINRNFVRVIEIGPTYLKAYLDDEGYIYLVDYTKPIGNYIKSDKFKPNKIFYSGKDNYEDMTVVSTEDKLYIFNSKTGNYSKPLGDSKITDIKYSIKDDDCYIIFYSENGKKYTGKNITGLYNNVQSSDKQSNIEDLYKKVK